MSIFEGSPANSYLQGSVLKKWELLVLIAMLAGSVRQFALDPSSPRNLTIHTSMTFLHLVAYGATILAFCFVVLSLACGLYYLAELVEEYTVFTKKIIKYATMYEPANFPIHQPDKSCILGQLCLSANDNALPLSDPNAADSIPSQRKQGLFKTILGYVTRRKDDALPSSHINVQEYSITPNVGLSSGLSSSMRTPYASGSLDNRKMM
ncbi:hypothetical protein NQZ79_g915 [Umbelopsis isabellina]|nr:hypothetical protein NQZ79_g915 [Umbelopsis isabellina]